MGNYTPSTLTLRIAYVDDNRDRVSVTEAQDEFDRAITKVRAEAMAEGIRAIERVKELHSKTYYSVSNELYGIDPKCDECGQSYPCTTIERFEGR